MGAIEIQLVIIAIPPFNIRKNLARQFNHLFRFNYDGQASLNQRDTSKFLRSESAETSAKFHSEWQIRTVEITDKTNSLW